jgi:hypothetical protein
MHQIEIHGGENAGSYGLVDTIDKLVKTEKLVEIIQKAECKNLKNHVFPKL